MAQVKRDWRGAQLCDGDRAMLAYAEKLTLNAAALTKGDLDELRHYFSEQQVYDIVVIASMFNFIDRIADAFGVELDSLTQRTAGAAPESEALKEFAAARRTHN